MAEAAAEEKSNSSLSVVDEPGVEVVSGEKEEAIRRVTRVRELREEHQQLFMSYAEEMYYINKNSLFHFVENPETGKKYTNFKEFIETETEYKVRRARYMIAIWEWYVEEHDRSFLEEVQEHGWTKLSKLVGKMTPSDYQDKWKDKLPDLSVREIRARRRRVRLKKSQRLRICVLTRPIGLRSSSSMSSMIISTSRSNRLSL